MGSSLAVHVELDQKELRQHIKEQIDREVSNLIFTWDIDEMTKRTSMSKRFLEDEFLRDPRMKLLERRKSKGKRFWFYNQSIEIMTEIMNEW